jgi:tetratricopeptide (TPR) repeat protein
MNSRTACIAALIAMTWTALAQADDQELAQALDGAAQDLAKNEWRKAERELGKVRADLEATKNAELRAKYGFYTALVNQQCADDEKVPKERRARARAASIDEYETYLRWNPNSGGTLNNLAQLYAQEPADREKALKLYDRAIALQDDRSTVYALNRAKLQGEMGQSDAALKASVDAVKKDPRNQAAQELTISLLEARGSSEDVGEYVRELNKAGLVIRAVDTAVREIGRLPAKREPVLIALAEVLANPALPGSPEEFAASESGKHLAMHADSADIGAGVKELMQLFAKPGNPQQFYWWRRDFNESGAKRGWFRGDALLGLARSLGDRCRRAGKERYECAESYYLFALEFASPNAEPNAFLSLSQIYGGTGRRDKLADIERRYEAQLFSGKGMAISRQDKKQEYDFHLALGTMYAYLDKWQDPRWSPASAIYQLEHAERAAEDFNRANPGAAQLQFPAQSAKLLSDGYMKTGQYDKAARTRITRAEKALASGDKDGAKDLIGGKWRASLPANVDPALKDRIGKVDERVKN